MFRLTTQAVTKKHITCGVPQGSVLGPLLFFLLYINDLRNISNQFEFFLFVDDTNIYFEANNLDKIQDVMNKGLKLLREWLIANRLALNFSKTNFTIFSPPQKTYKNITLLMIKVIEQKVYVKYLGALLDSKLSFCHHISSIRKKDIKSNWHNEQNEMFCLQKCFNMFIL